MPAIFRAYETEKERAHTGGNGPHDRNPSGWGGDGDNRGDRPENHRSRLLRYRLGLAVAMVSVLMIFTALASAYIVRQGGSYYDESTRAIMNDWQRMRVPPILWMNTLILLISSLTMEFARRAAFSRDIIVRASGKLEVQLEERRTIPWLAMTIILGGGFLGGQYIAWRDLARQGVFIASNPSSSFFYVLTGSHALHLVGGVVALLYAGASVLWHKSADFREIVLDITGWYWHFLAILWLAILGLFYYAR